MVQLSQYEKQLKALTYNNIGCYYKRIGKPKAALNYLN